MGHVDVALKANSDNPYRVSQVVMNDVTPENEKQVTKPRYAFLYMMAGFAIGSVIVNTPIGGYCLDVAADWMYVVIDWLFA